jgi:hypothetical protein
MTDEELRRKASLAIRIALKGDSNAVFDDLRECVGEMDEDAQNKLYRASELVGDAVLDLQARERP